MIIAVLSRNPSLYSTQSLVNAARKRKHRVLVLDPYYCTQTIQKGTHRLFYHGKPLPVLHAIIPRIGATATEIGASVIDQFVSAGTYSTTRSQSLLLARNKWSCSQYLAIHDIPVPDACLHFNNELNDLVLRKFKFPVIIKLLKSTQGMGVVKANDRHQAQSILESFQRLDEQVIIQEFIQEAKGSDIRILVVNNQVVGTMKRQSRAGEFRSNLHQGASAKPIKITDEEERLALKTAKCLGLEVAGIDMLRSKRGPLILEVNASPGLEGIEHVMKKSISEEIIKLVEHRVG